MILCCDACIYIYLLNCKGKSNGSLIQFLVECYGTVNCEGPSKIENYGCCQLGYSSGRAVGGIIDYDNNGPGFCQTW